MSIDGQRQTFVSDSCQLSVCAYEPVARWPHWERCGWSSGSATQFDPLGCPCLVDCGHLSQPESETLASYRRCLEVFAEVQTAGCLTSCCHAAGLQLQSEPLVSPSGS